MVLVNDSEFVLNKIVFYLTTRVYYPIKIPFTLLYNILWPFSMLPKVKTAIKRKEFLSSKIPSSDGDKYLIHYFNISNPIFK